MPYNDHRFCRDNSANGHVYENLEMPVFPEMPIYQNNGLPSRLIVKPIASNERKKNSFPDSNREMYLQSGFAPFIPKVRNFVGRFFCDKKYYGNSNQ